MISPEIIIEPLREDLEKIVPNTFLVTTSFKRWIVSVGLQNLWLQCLDYVKRERTVVVLGDFGSMDAGDALTVLLNNLYIHNKSYLPQFIVSFLKLYSKEKNIGIDVRNIKQDLLVAQYSEEQISALETIQEVMNPEENSVSEITKEQLIRTLEKKYQNYSHSEINSRRAIDTYLEWYKETLLYLSDFYTVANPDFAMFKALDNSQNGYGLRDNFKLIFGNYNLLMKNATNQMIEIKTDNEKTPMVFISHSSNDKPFVEALVDLLESIGMTSKNLFCSSVEGYGLHLSDDIFETIRNLYLEHQLYVIFIHSPRYYESPICLNEMGAAWVLKTDFCSILTKDMEFSAMSGVVTSNAISIKVNGKDASARLTEMKDKLVSMIGLTPIDNTKWERKRNNFLRLVKE